MAPMPKMKRIMATTKAMPSQRQQDHGNHPDPEAREHWLMVRFTFIDLPPFSLSLCVFSSLSSLSPWLDCMVHTNSDAVNTAPQPRANGMVISITFSLTFVDGCFGQIGQTQFAERDMRKDQIGCAAVFELAIDMVDVAVRVRGDAGVGISDQFFAVAVLECVGGAGGDAGGFLPVVDALGAEGAFIDERAVHRGPCHSRSAARRTGRHSCSNGSRCKGPGCRSPVHPRFGISAHRAG